MRLIPSGASELHCKANDILQENYSTVIYRIVGLANILEKQFHPIPNSSIDTPPHIGYPCQRPGRSGAAEPAKPRQGRKTATVRECLWVPPVTCSDIYLSL